MSGLFSLQGLGGANTQPETEVAGFRFRKRSGCTSAQPA